MSYPPCRRTSEADPGYSWLPKPSQIDVFPCVFIDFLLIWVCVDKCRVGVCWYVDNYGVRRLFHVLEYVRMYVCTYVRMYVCTCVQMYVCTYLHM